MKPQIILNQAMKWRKRRMKIRFKHWTSNLRSITRGGNIYIYIYMTIWNKTIRNEVTVYE